MDWRQGAVSNAWILYPIERAKRRDIVSKNGPATQYEPAGRLSRETRHGRAPRGRRSALARQGSWSFRTIRSPYTAATWLPVFAWNFTVTSGLPCTSDDGTSYVTS